MEDCRFWFQQRGLFQDCEHQSRFKRDIELSRSRARTRKRLHEKSRYMGSGLYTLRNRHSTEGFWTRFGGGKLCRIKITIKDPPNWQWTLIGVFHNDNLRDLALGVEQKTFSAEFGLQVSEAQFVPSTVVFWQGGSEQLPHRCFCYSNYRRIIFAIRNVFGNDLRNRQISFCNSSSIGFDHGASTSNCSSTGLRPIRQQPSASFNRLPKTHAVRD